MSTKFTQGPWYPTKNSHFWEVNTGPNYYDSSVAFVWLDAAEANARLIAAAPAMFEALERTYLALLRISATNMWRITNQHVYASLVGVIADATGQDRQQVQEHYEAIAAAGGDA